VIFEFRIRKPVKFYPDHLRFAGVIREKPILSNYKYAVTRIHDSVQLVYFKFKLFSVMYFFQAVDSMPLRVLETVLMKACERLWMNREMTKAEPFVTLSSVSYLWWQTLAGLPQPDPDSRAPHWARHQIRRLLDGETFEL